MYKRHNGQISLFDEPEFFGTIPLNPKNEWVRLGKTIPWTEFEERYAENFKSATGQPAISGRMALASVLIKQRYKISDDCWNCYESVSATLSRITAIPV